MSLVITFPTEAKQITGVGEARNRTRLAVERTVPYISPPTALAPGRYRAAQRHECIASLPRRVGPGHGGRHRLPLGVSTRRVERLADQR